MKTRMTILAISALAALIGASLWATSKISIVPAAAGLLQHPDQGSNPWFVATLFDAYFGFLWFWAWIAYKETRHRARLAWLVLLLALGNIAMAAYMLLQLRRLPPGATAEQLLLRRA
jgi:drug/metabolite transporter (DMT)-like permease